MSEKIPFQRLVLSCKAPLQSRDPGKILITDGGGQTVLVSCYIKAFINVGEQLGCLVSYATRHKYLRDADGHYKALMHGTCSFKKPNITQSELEHFAALSHIHAEIIYNMVDSDNSWSILYNRFATRKDYP